MSSDIIKSISPRQPYFVIATSHYYKVVVMEYGISHFYSFCAEKRSLDCIMGVPDGCVDILFCCDKNNPSVTIYGTGLHVRPMILKENKYYFGVRFLPGQCEGFHDVSFKDLIGIEVPLFEIMNNDIYMKIVNSRNFEEQIDIFMKYYLKRFIINNKCSNLSKYILDSIITSYGNTKVEDIALDVSYSTRYVNKVFNDNFGMSPKKFSKLIRFQNLINMLNYAESQGEKMSDIAFDLEYCDQSHMIREFKQLIDITPKSYIDFLKERDYDKRLIIIDKLQYQVQH